MLQQISLQCGTKARYVAKKIRPFTEFDGQIGVTGATFRAAAGATIDRLPGSIDGACGSPRCLRHLKNSRSAPKPSRIALIKPRAKMRLFVMRPNYV
jgi:hypothetical protein